MLRKERRIVIIGKKVEKKRVEGYNERGIAPKKRKNYMSKLKGPERKKSVGW